MIRTYWMAVRPEFEPSAQAGVVSFSKKVYPFWPVLVCYRNEFERDLKDNQNGL